MTPIMCSLECEQLPLVYCVGPDGNVEASAFALANYPNKNQLETCALISLARLACECCCRRTAAKVFSFSVSVFAPRSDKDDAVRRTHIERRIY